MGNKGAHAEHPPQKFSPGSFENPQEAQVMVNIAPHLAQKRRASRFSCWHRGHFMPKSPHAPQFLSGGIAEILLI